MNSIFHHREHSHTARDINALHEDQMSTGAKIADTVASTVGSWRFIIIQSTLLFCWILFNSIALFAWKWDPAPFILLNLMLSFQAAYTGPVVMMSQNRQAAKDRITAEETYRNAKKSEEETRAVMEHLTAQDAELLKQTIELLRQTQLLEAQATRIEKLARRIDQATGRGAA